MAPRLIERPTVIQAAGEKPKTIEEHVGRTATGSEPVSIARMRSPAGWTEPGQTPDFDEYTLVLDGVLHVAHADGEIEVHVGQAVHAPAGEWVRYSTPAGADYVAVCLPAFSPDTVHRDA
jgi:ethanolamine utilization protein EutQ (cupin superfamily)